jgi:uncharacterized membrane protein YdjX (TVP38/TMEM64 family)
VTATAGAVPTRGGVKRPALWILGGLLVVLFGLGIVLLPLGEWGQSLTTWFERLGAAGPIAFGLAYMLAAILLIPVWPLSITGGLVFGSWGFVIVPIAATLGACAAFLISRYLARGRVRAWLAGRPRYQAVDRAIGEEGWKVVVLLRLSPLVPYNLMNYFCGMTRISCTSYVMATFVGTIPVTAMYVYLGFVGQAVAGGSMAWPQWVLLVVGLAATAAVTVLVTRKVRQRLDAPQRPARLPLT